MTTIYTTTGLEMIDGANRIVGTKTAHGRYVCELWVGQCKTMIHNVLHDRRLAELWGAGVLNSPGMAGLARAETEYAARRERSAIARRWREANREAARRGLRTRYGWED